MGSESSVSSDPYERIKQLERVVEEQEEQIDELRGRIENQQSNLAHLHSRCTLHVLRSDPM